ncbi:MAG: Rad52/Rad22 family DNA repair protein [Pseudomonadota bacterium]
MFLEKSEESSENPIELEISDKDESYGRPLSEILSDLRRPIPSHIVHTRQQGGRRVKYLTMQDTIAILDQYAPGWEGTITNIYSARDRLYVAYRITIHAKEGKFSREATGSSGLEPNAQGDPSSSAEAAALRNAAAKFGLALYL